MNSPLWGKYCDGGHFCSAPKECCTLGCCYFPAANDRMFELLFLWGWVFWALVTFAVLSTVCICSLVVWRFFCSSLQEHVSSVAACCCCCRGRDDRACSEPDSVGSMYAPPHYSRCNSFHHAPPPPYTEVTSKPDLYPLVISYNGDTGMNRGGSASYLMVQYFRNYILRPSGSISATSTIDSLSSSFICNAVNEANTIIPPPYSCTGSLDGFSITANTAADVQMLHSVSSVMCNEYQQTHSSSAHSQQSVVAQPTPRSSPSGMSLNTHHSVHSQSYAQTPNRTSPVENVSTNKINPNFMHNKINNKASGGSRYDSNETQNYLNMDGYKTGAKKGMEIDGGILLQKKNHLFHKKNQISTENSVDSESQDDHNFSELLNLSVCAPSNLNCENDLNNFGMQTLAELQQSYSIANSITVSDISSLANLGTPDSPPRATSPTVEIRELLDKIQQLPQQKSPTFEIYNYNETAQPTNSKFFIKNKSKTLYMPLNAKVTPKPSTNIFAGTSNIFNYAKTTKAWLSRSAPTTPCGNFTPLFPSQRKNLTGSQKGSRLKEDGSALLEGIDFEHNDECL